MPTHKPGYKKKDLQTGLLNKYLHRKKKETKRREEEEFQKKRKKSLLFPL